MSLIKSISGIRGTIGGQIGDNLTPADIVDLVSAFIKVRRNRYSMRNKIVVGRDARISGEIIANLVCSTCMSMGIDVVDIGMATTPTTEIATAFENALGGIIITASHNPMHWNALKLLNEKGEFIDKCEGEEVLQVCSHRNFIYAQVEKLGQLCKKDYLTSHLEKILSLSLVNVEAIRSAHLSVVVDAVNSVGGVFVPALLHKLGVERVVPLNCEPNGMFAHNPEPLPEHLTELCEVVKKEQANVGFAVDPDVDRLAIVCEDGNCFSEEYTLVSVADYVLSNEKGAVVSNLSSTRALSDVCKQYNVSYYSSAVGEVNVVNKMKEVKAIIGGEGNGGVIYPQCHYGRDALVGIALFLSLLAKTNKKVSELRNNYPSYYLCKKKILLNENNFSDAVIEKLKQIYKNKKLTDIDGLKIDFDDSWAHIRKSNTEPIIRIYTEATTKQKAQNLADEIINLITC